MRAVPQAWEPITITPLVAEQGYVAFDFCGGEVGRMKDGLRASLDVRKVFCLLLSSDQKMLRSMSFFSTFCCEKSPVVGCITQEKRRCQAARRLRFDRVNRSMSGVGIRHQREFPHLCVGSVRTSRAQTARRHSRAAVHDNCARATESAQDSVKRIASTRQNATRPPPEVPKGKKCFSGRSVYLQQSKSPAYGPAGRPDLRIYKQQQRPPNTAHTVFICFEQQCLET